MMLPVTSKFRNARDIAALLDRRQHCLIPLLSNRLLLSRIKAINFRRS